MQLDALAGAGCTRTFMEKVSGVARDRPQLAVGDAKSRLAQRLRAAAPTITNLQIARHLSS